MSLCLINSCLATAVWQTQTSQSPDNIVAHKGDVLLRFTTRWPRRNQLAHPKQTWFRKFCYLCCQSVPPWQVSSKIWLTHLNCCFLYCRQEVHYNNFLKISQKCRKYTDDNWIHLKKEKLGKQEMYWISFYCITEKKQNNSS